MCFLFKKLTVNFPCVSQISLSPFPSLPSPGSPSLPSAPSLPPSVAPALNHRRGKLPL